MLKAIKKQQGGILLRLFMVQMGVEQSGQQVQDPQILEKFSQLFDEP